jgi:hypothetical protein
MPLRELFKRNNIRPAWQFRAKGVVWRLIPAPSGLFLGEDRSLDTKRATFFCVDHATGEVLWQDVATIEQWWLGVEAIHRDRILLHGFAQPDMPEHRGIIALDLFTGKQVWRRDDLKFLCAAGDAIFGSINMIDRRVVIELKARDGSEAAHHDELPIYAREARTEDLTVDECLFPSVLDEESEDLALPRESVLRHCKSDLMIGSVEYIEWDGLIAVSFHEKTNSEGVLSLRLAIIDSGRDEVVYSEMLEPAVRGFVPDAFFVRSRFLFYVKERTLLIALRYEDLKK